MTAKKINPNPPAPKSKAKKKQPAPKKAAPTTVAQQKLEEVASGLGCVLNWKTGKKIWTPKQLQAFAVNNKLPANICNSITPLSLKMAVSQAEENKEWKAIRLNKKRIEVTEVFRSDKGQVTYALMGFVKNGNDEKAKPTRDTIDKVVYDEKDKKWMSQGINGTKEATEFCRIVDFHLEHYTASDVNTKVTTPMLKALNSCRIGSSSYFVRQTTANDEMVTNWSKFMSDIGYELFPVTAAKDLRTQGSLASGATAHMEKELDVLVKTVEKWEKDNRIHGRSKDACLDKLGTLMENAEKVEEALQCKLTELTSAIDTLQKQAMTIINSVAPNGVPPAIYEGIKELLKRDRVLQETPHGKVYFFMVDEISEYVSGKKLNTSAGKVIKELGYYSYIQDGICVLRPLAELKS